MFGVKFSSWNEICAIKKSWLSLNKTFSAYFFLQWVALVLGSRNVMHTRIEKYSLKLEMEMARLLIERCNIFLLGGSITHWCFFVQTPLTSEIVASNKFHSFFPFLFNHFAWLMFVRTYWILLLCLPLSLAHLTFIQLFFF